jgi:hypothetical protein
MNRFQMLVSTLAVLMPFALAGCEGEPDKIRGTNFVRRVTAEELQGHECSHRTGGDFSFNWSFDRDTFVIEGDDIPPDLVTAMLGPDASATRIEGTWHIHGHIIDFLVRTDDPEAEPRKSSLHIFFTGVIRVSTSEAQYVFSPKR